MTMSFGPFEVDLFLPALLLVFGGLIASPLLAHWTRAPVLRFLDRLIGARGIEILTISRAEVAPGAEVPLTGRVRGRHLCDRALVPDAAIHFSHPRRGRLRTEGDQTFYLADDSAYEDVVSATLSVSDRCLATAAIPVRVAPRVDPLEWLAAPVRNAACVLVSPPGLQALVYFLLLGLPLTVTETVLNLVAMKTLFAGVPALDYLVAVGLAFGLVLGAHLRAEHEEDAREATFLFFGLLTIVTFLGGWATYWMVRPLHLPLLLVIPAVAVAAALRGFISWLAAAAGARSLAPIPWPETLEQQAPASTAAPPSAPMSPE